MSKRTDRVIRQILEIEGVSNAHATNGAVDLIDGRTLIPLNLYLEKPEEKVLGIHIKEEIGTEDIFGGTDG